MAERADHRSNRKPASVALVTGAAKRIGRAIAVALARDGWDIAVHYATSGAEARQTVREIRACGRRAVALKRDLHREAGVRSLLADCAAALAPVTCVVNNASLFEPDTAADFSTQKLLAHMRVNVAAPVHLAHALHRSLPRGERGVVINLLDQKLWNPNPDFLSYTLSKAALKEATRLLAQALAPKVRVVGVAPGLTLPSHLQSAAAFRRTHAMAPLGRSSNPEEIGAAVAYLARAAAVTGATLIVDGGQHLQPTARDFSFI
ncbi:MAG TPA: SDR family oxidoreductase [Burkholderiaceae bacterium]|nr:SDR family oxidoreductase [Burkholderiaceae bacterium]